MHQGVSHFWSLRGLLGKKGREAIHKLHPQISLVIKINCGLLIMSPFLHFHNVHPSDFWAIPTKPAERYQSLSVTPCFDEF